MIYTCRWREETGLITSKFERSVAELNRKLAEEKKRSREMADKYTRHKSNNEKVYTVAHIQCIIYYTLYKLDTLN